MPESLESMTQVKSLDIKEFVEKGYLHEANRQFFHPLGLALEVMIDDDGKYSLNSIWDNREDPEGIILAKTTRSKAELVMKEQEDRSAARMAALGYNIQPLDEDN